jgi:hypothetical protein
MSEQLTPKERQELEQASETAALLRNAYQIFTHPTVNIINNPTARKANLWKAAVKKHLKIED